MPKINPFIALPPISDSPFLLILRKRTDQTAGTASAGSTQDEHYDWSVLSDEELWAVEALLAKAAKRPARKPELLVSETLARIAEG